MRILCSLHLSLQHRLRLRGGSADTSPCQSCWFWAALHSSHYLFILKTETQREVDTEKGRTPPSPACRFTPQMRTATRLGKAKPGSLELNLCLSHRGQGPRHFGYRHCLPGSALNRKLELGAESGFELVWDAGILASVASAAPGAHPDCLH